MEKQSMMGVLAFGVVALVLVTSAEALDAIKCKEALLTLAPCQHYLAGEFPIPNSHCCVGVAKLHEEATTQEARMALCKCFKSAAPTFKVVAEKAKLLPELCHVKLASPIDLEANCSQISLVE